MTLALAAGALALFFWAGWSDVASRRIPNRLCALLTLVGLARIGLALASGGPALEAAADLALGAGLFAAGAVAFRFGAFGGGDVKLLAAGGLWTGLDAAGPYLMTTALTGGALALFYLARMAASRMSGTVVAAKEITLPYGVAIATGGAFATAALV